MRTEHVPPTIQSRFGMTNHIRLSVTDIPRAERFYAPIMEFLQYRFVSRSDTRLAWSKMTAGINVEAFILSAVTPENQKIRHDRYAPGLHHYAWNADNRAQVDELYQLLKAHNVEVLDPPAEYDYRDGYYAVFFSDPDGMKLELVHIPQLSVMR
jgi:glyoxylase I family protein